ncbi:MAG: PIN domain-containing protein [Clostridia bacterium]|nr:PIN domain-containing protein [Clostridia bacterium]
MRLMIDGNVVLDVLQNREPHVADSAKIWKLCETNQVEGFVSGLTFANLVYIMRRELTPEKINEVFRSLELIFQFVDLTVSDLEKAADMQWDDYEDALQAAAAERIHADVIITRNVKDFRKSKVSAFTPAEFLERHT